MRIPKLSVVLPAHRYDDYLKQSIASILSQSFYDFELILVWNGDNKTYFEKLKEEFCDPRIKYLHSNVKNLVFALNLGIDAAVSDYVVRMDSDDISNKNRLGVIWEAIKCHPDIDVFGSSFNIIDPSGKLVKRGTVKNMNTEQVRRRLPFRCCISHPTVAFKKKSIIAIGSYAFGQFSEDYDLWLRLSRSPETKFLILDDILIGYRMHTLQATSSANDSNILAYDLSLKIRELLLTKRLIFVFGMAFTILDFWYKKLISLKVALLARR